MAKPSGRRQNRPMSISTHHQRRSIIMTVLFLIGLGIAIFLYCAFGLHMFERQAQQGNANTQSPVTATEENGTVEASQLNIETAVNKIDTYYSLLSQKKSDQLRNEGFEAAAGAVEMGWLDDIEYSVDANNINPDATAFPAPVGSYAGNDVFTLRVDKVFAVEAVLAGSGVTAEAYAHPEFEKTPGVDTSVDTPPSSLPREICVADAA